MGQKITFKNSDWATVYLNMRKSLRQWGMIARVLERTGTTMRARGVMYKAVVQLVILYGSNSWEVTGEMLKGLKLIHQRAARRITGMMATLLAGGEWDYQAI